jgi:hypothetical protein
LPAWTQYILGAAALLIALGVLWTKALRPFGLFIYKFVRVQREMLPLLQQLTDVFKDSPNAFNVLDEIVAQFRTDSGSSLRDAVNRIEEAGKQAEVTARKAHDAAEELKVGVAAMKILDEQDRAERRELTLKLDRVSERVQASAATSRRIEEAAHKRADTAGGESGAAADAAVQREQ